MNIVMFRVAPLAVVNTAGPLQVGSAGSAVEQEALPFLTKEKRSSFEI